MKIQTLGRYAGIVMLIIITITIIFVARTSKKGPSKEGPTLVTINGPISKIITITKERSSEISLITKSGILLDSTIGIIQRDVSYTIHYNGGVEKEDGWDEIIPAVKDREAIGWKKQPKPFSIKSVSFSIPKDSKKDRAEIKFTITE